MAGMALALHAGHAWPSLWPVILAGLGLVLAYANGMAMNDLLDEEFDRMAHSERPLPSGDLSRKFVRRLVAITGLASISCLGAARPILFVSGALLLISIYLYDSTLKMRPVPASLAMGSCRALSMATGLLLVGGIESILTPMILVCLSYMALITALTQLSQSEDEKDPRPNAAAVCILVFAYCVPAILAQGQAIEVVAALAIAIHVLAPSLRRPVNIGLSIKRGVFTTVLWNSLICLAVGARELAMGSAGLYLVIPLLARKLGQKGS